MLAEIATTIGFGLATHPVQALFILSLVMHAVRMTLRKSARPRRRQARDGALRRRLAEAA